MDEKKTIWDVVNPKKAFAGGILIGFLVSGVIALAVTLGIVVSDGEMGSDTAKAKDTEQVADDADGAEVTEMNVDDFRHVRGAEDPEIYLVEFLDYECSFCGRHHPTMEGVLEKYDGQVAWVFKHFPLSFHPEAGPSGIAAECAGEQGKFWEYGDELITNQTELGADFYTEVAQDLGLDMGDFEKCLEDDDIAARLTEDQKLGASAGVRGTPATFLVDKDGTILNMISGAVPQTQFEAALDAELN